MGSGAGCLPYLRRGRIPAGWTKRYLPALRLGDLHSVDWPSGRVQSHRRAVARGWGGLSDRYFVVGASRKGDSSVAALWFVPPLAPPTILCSCDLLPILLDAVRATSSLPGRRWHWAWE